MMAADNPPSEPIVPFSKIYPKIRAPNPAMIPSMVDKSML
jgi:hypothetical protein